jgi:hypothetical protein
MTVDSKGYEYCPSWVCVNVEFIIAEERFPMYTWKTSLQQRVNSFFCDTFLQHNIIHSLKITIFVENLSTLRNFELFLTLITHWSFIRHSFIILYLPRRYRGGVGSKPRQICCEKRAPGQVFSEHFGILLSADFHQCTVLKFHSSTTQLHNWWHRKIKHFSPESFIFMCITLQLTLKL